MPRELREAPESSLDSSGRPRAGSYAGALERIELPHTSRLARLARRKRWLYLAVASEDVYIAFAAVDVSYATNAFFFVYEAHAHARAPGGRILAHASATGTPRMMTFDDTLPRTGRIAVRHRALRANVTVTRDAIDLDVAVPGGASIAASLQRAHAKTPPPITAIADLGDSRVQITEKAALLPSHVRLRTAKDGAGARTRTLEALGGYDFSHGLLQRHTAWRWAFVLGRTRAGAPVAVNLASGFVGGSECAVWTESGVFPLEEGRFDFDRNDAMAPWDVRTSDGAALRFTPGALHQENKNLGIVRSRFVQPVGMWSGAVPCDGATLDIDGALGVAEDQDVLW